MSLRESYDGAHTVFCVVFSASLKLHVMRCIDKKKSSFQDLYAMILIHDVTRGGFACTTESVMYSSPPNKRTFRDRISLSNFNICKLMSEKLLAPQATQLLPTAKIQINKIHTVCPIDIGPNSQPNISS